MKIQKMQKLESLKEFQLKQEEANQVQGGKRIIWTGEGEVEYGTGSIGTYVDGINTGTDGYQDAE